MTDKYKTRIETVIVDVQGQTIDCLSFTSASQAEAYKRGVRNWADRRGLCARVYTQVMEAARKTHDNERAASSSLAFAI